MNDSVAAKNFAAIQQFMRETREKISGLETDRDHLRSTVTMLQTELQTVRGNLYRVMGGMGNGATGGD